MSDVENTSNPGTTAPKKNWHKETVIANCTSFRNDNEAGTACYLGGTEKDGKLVIKTEKPITNAINGQKIKGTNQLIIQNAFKKAGIKDREVVVYNQVEKIGIHIKKGSPCVNISIPTSFEIVDGQKKFKPNVITEFPKSSCFSFDENHKPCSPNGDFALAKLNSARFGKVMKNRAIAFNEKTPAEKKAELFKLNAYEHKKAIDFLTVTGGDVAAYRAKSINPEEAKYLDSIEKDSPTPTLEQQKGRAVAELKRIEDYRKEHEKNTPVPVIDATNTNDPVDYLGKYMAACELGAEFHTDKASQNEVQSRLNNSLEKNFETNNFDSVFTLGAEIDERAKAVITDFRNMSNEQQRGVTPERTVVHERPEQTVDAITF